METQGYVTKTWSSEYITEALRLSVTTWNAYVEHGNRSTVAETRKVFLIGGKFREEGGTVLVESDDTGEKWGVTEFMADFSSAAQAQRNHWLERAADFGGSLYLVDLQLCTYGEVQRAVLDRESTSSYYPHTLFIMFDFIDPTMRFRDSSYRLPSLSSIMPPVENLAVYKANLHHVYRSISERKLKSVTVRLHTLHLEDTELSANFVSELSEGKAFDVFHTLFLVDIKGVFGKNKLIRFMIGLASGSLQLRGLALKGSISIYPEDCIIPNAFVGAVVDAIHKSGLQFLDLNGLEKDPRIQAQLLRNRLSPTLQTRQIHKVPAKSMRTLQTRQLHKVPAKSMRLFICGDAYAGKTTLLSTLMSTDSHGLHILHKVKAKLWPHATTMERTRGIEIHTIARHNIRMSIWDMAGQTEFHAFHDHMFPDPSASHGSPAMFMFVWSPIDSKSGKQGQSKSQHEFESSFHYWLKFITSKTRQTNIRRKLIIVLTRMDQTRLVKDALQASINTLSTTYSNTIEVMDTLEVDARSEASVKPLLTYIFDTAQVVLEGIEVYSICSEVSEHLSKRHNQKASAGQEPIISWNDFSSLCIKQFEVIDPDIQKAIAYSLNESGDIIYLSNLPFLVLDPNWFCNEVMGNLIHFSLSEHTSKAILLINGYASQDYLEKLLMESCHFAVKGSVLLALLEAMHLCCKVPDDPQRMVFIPATLNASSVSECFQWRRGRSSAQDYVHMGRRLECDRKDSTFLTLGLFCTIQVAFNKAFLQRKGDVKLGEPDVKMGKDFMSICVQDSEILVEWGLAGGEHVIDVMMRTPNDEDAAHTLAYVEEKIIKTIIGVCAQPVGNQGVRLVESVIRPDCLHTPSCPQVRADQCALILDLKQELKEQLKGGQRYEKLLHLWKGTTHLQPITDHFMDLLGPKEFMQVLMSYKVVLEDVCSMNSTSTSGQASHGIDAASTSSTVRRNLENIGDDTQAMAERMTEGDTQVEVGENEQVVDALSNNMVKAVYRKLQSIDGKFVDLTQAVNSLHKDMGTKLDAMHKSIQHLRDDALPKLQRLVEQSLNFAVENEAGKVPRLVFLTTDNGNLVTTFLRGLKRVRIELFCEHREQPHRVEKQKGLLLYAVDEESLLKRALPYANGFLKVLTLVAKVGAQQVAGAGSLIPDFSQIVALAEDTPGFLENDSSLANVSSSPGEDFHGWRQWLVSALDRHGGMTESTIESMFMLRRALYKDTLQVAWLCDTHYKSQSPLPFVH